MNITCGTSAGLNVHFKILHREWEQNIDDGDENDPTGKEMSNVEILDKLEAQAFQAQQCSSTHFSHT